METRGNRNLWLVGLLALTFSLRAHAVITLPPKSKCADIQTTINSLPSAGGSILIPAGKYICGRPIIIDRNNVTLRGDGPATKLVLGAHANSPLLIIGQASNEPTVTRSNIVISDLSFDGNRANQDYECWKNNCASVRNNGVSVRRANDVVLERLTTRRARSGGVVIEKGSRRVTVRDLESSENSFDGLAMYQTEDSIFSGLLLHDNCYAGLSLDLGFNNNIISDVQIFRGPGAGPACGAGGFGKVGVFMRESTRNVLRGLHIHNTREHGIFIADGPTGPATKNIFSNLIVTGIVDATMNGIRVNDSTCVDNALDASILSDNEGSDISESAPLVRGDVSIY